MVIYIISRNQAYCPLHLFIGPTRSLCVIALALEVVAISDFLSKRISNIQSINLLQSHHGILVKQRKTEIVCKKTTMSIAAAVLVLWPSPPYYGVMGVMGATTVFAHLITPEFSFIYVIRCARFACCIKKTFRGGDDSQTVITNSSSCEKSRHIVFMIWHGRQIHIHPNYKNNENVANLARFN